MNKNPYSYAYWAVLAFICYSVVGLLTEQEFLPNSVWFFTGKPASGFCADCQTGFALILVVIVLVPVALWLRSKTQGSRALLSTRNIAILVAVPIVASLVGGFFVLQKKSREESMSQTQYNASVQNNEIVRNTLSEKNSPLKPYFMNLVLQDGVATVYFTEMAGPFLDTAGERTAYLKPLETELLNALGASAIQWGVGSKVL